MSNFSRWSSALGSSGPGELPRAILARTEVAEGLVRPAVIVPADPVGYGASRLREAGKLMLPDTLFLETAKEPFDEPVLLRRVRRDELLGQPIVPTGLPELPTLKDQAIVTAQDRRREGPHGPEASEAGGVGGACCLLRLSPQGKLVADQLPIMAIDHRGQMAPAVLAGGFGNRGLAPHETEHQGGPAFGRPPFNGVC